MITLRFVTSNDAASHGIRAGEYGFWATHVEAKIGKTWLGSHANGGVMQRPLDYDAGRWTQQQIICIGVGAAEKEDAFERFLLDQIGKPYDYAGIAGLVLGRNWRNPDSWFCSELQAAALEHAGVILPLATEANHITPRDLLIALSSQFPIPPIETAPAGSR